MSATTPSSPRSGATALYTTMARIRAFETAAERLFLGGELPGFIHVSIGQEASAAGVIAHLTPSDYLTTTHRGHGHTLAKGADMTAMTAELFGRDSGVCRGRGGSMHIADFGVGMLGANGIVAGGVGIAVGAALGARLRGEGHRVAVTFFGDGATARGPFAEAINLAQLWRLPVVFACESNGWASTTRSSEALASTRIADRGSAIGMRTEVVDGNDVFAVERAAAAAVDHARTGQGPTLLQLDTFRLRGHFVGDPTTYYDQQELEQWHRNDPLLRARRAVRDGVVDADGLDDAALDRIEASAEAEVIAAVDAARAAPEPDLAGLHEHLYADPGPRTPSEVVA